LCASGLGFGLWARFWTPLENIIVQQSFHISQNHFLSLVLCRFDMDAEHNAKQGKRSLLNRVVIRIVECILFKQDILLSELWAIRKVLVMPKDLEFRII
jgi:hypothetical protein